MTALERPGARLEHRLTRPNVSLAELYAAVDLALEHELAGLTVSPWLVRPAQRRLGASRLRLGTSCLRFTGIALPLSTAA